MVQGGRVVLTALVFLAALLSVGEGIICFEDPTRTVTVPEAVGQACINVTRSAGEPDTFAYGALAARRSGAAEGADFLTVPAGARSTDRFPTYQMVSFGSSLTVEICVTVILDDFACETEEGIAVFLRQDTAVCTDGSNEAEFEILIEDSTHLPVSFQDSKLTVMEGAGDVQIVIQRNQGMQGGISNLNSANVRLFEDPDESGCLEPGYSRNLQIGCNDPTACADAGPVQMPNFEVDAPLATNDMVVDGHMYCSVVIEAQPGCLFNFTDGNRLQLVVLDDETLGISFNPDFEQVSEDSGPLALTLQLTQAVDQPFTVLLDSSLLPPADDAATVDDFTPGPYEVIFPAGQTTTTVNIPITDDELFEASTNDFKVIFVNFTANFTIAANPQSDTLTVQIVDDDEVNVEFPSEDLSALEDSGNLSFVLSSDRDSEIAYDVTVISQTSTGSAAADNEDFTSGMADVRFNPGSRSSTEFVVQLMIDPDPEADETFALRLRESTQQEQTQSARIILPPSFFTKEATILNDDPPHEVCFSQPEYRVMENVGAVDITVRLNGTLAKENISVRVFARSTGSGPTDTSVIPEDDILNAEWNVTILAGDPDAFFSIVVIADPLAEADEMFGLELTVDAEPYFAVPCSPGDTTTVVIENDDIVQINSTAAAFRVEGEDLVYEVTFTAQTAFVIPFQLTVNFLNGTATAGEDFVADPITLSFTESESTVIASIPIINDAIVEGTEMILFLTVAENSLLDIDVSQAQGSLTIIDNEAEHHFDSTMLTIAVNESDGSVPVTVVRRGYLQRESTVVIQPMMDTAEGPGDFPIAPIDVTFPPGETMVTVNVAITQDMISEVEESFLLQLMERTSVGGALVEDLVVVPDVATVLIRDPGDVVCVSFSQANYSVLENGGVAQFVVQADKDFTYTFDVEVQLMPVTAQLGQDYLPASLSLTFTPGSRTAQGNISIEDDMIREMATETVLMVLSPSPGNARDVCVATPGTATLIIVDDDNLAVVFEMASYSVAEGNNISICVLTNITSDTPVVVMVTPQTGREHSLDTSMVTFDPGETRQCVQFSADADDIKERTEQVTLTLSLMEQDGVSVGDPGQTVVDITDTTGLSVEFELPYYPVMEGGTVVVNVVLSNDFDESFRVDIMPERTGDITFSPPFLVFTSPLTSLLIQVSATTDNIAELMENITLSLVLSDTNTQSYGVDLGDQATTVIGVEDATDDVIVTFDPDTYTLDEGSTTVATVTADKLAGVDYSCTVQQLDGMDDFQLADPTVTFIAGSDEATFTIMALSDVIKEDDETFMIALQCSSASAIAVGVVVGGSGTAIVTVQDTTADIVVVFDPVSYSVLEGDSVGITLRADRNFSVPFNVTLSSNNVEDVQFQSNVATFQPSSRTVSFTLDAVTDDIQELNEIVTLDFEITATIGVSKGSDSQAEVTVMDNTPTLLVNFEQPAYSVVEGDTITIGVVADKESSLPFSVTVRAAGQGEGEDFQLGLSTLLFFPGQLTSSFQFTALADSLKELNETFTLSLEITDTGGVDIATGADNTTQVTIIDSTSIIVNFEEVFYSVVEGEGVLVTVVANGPSSFDYTVDLATSPGSAEGSDYNPGPYQAQFIAGATSADVLVSSLSDACAEPRESFTLDLALSPAAQAIGIQLGTQSQATVGITDPTVVSVTFEETSYQTVEGEPIIAQLLADTCFEGTITVTLEAIIGTADDTDFGQPPPGVMQGQRFNVTINTTDDSVPERTEDFQMILRVVSPSGLNVTTGTEDLSITITITDNDPILVSFEQASHIVVEGNTVNITLLADAASANVPYTATVVPTGGGENEDYEFVGSSSATFTSGAMASSIQLRALSDTVEDCNETFPFTLNITDTGGLTVSAGAMSTTQVTIIDATELTVSFAAAAYKVAEGNILPICIVMDMASCVTVTAGVTPESGPDYSLDTSMVTFDPGETRQCVQFSPTVDDIKEGTEQFTLTLSLMGQDGVSLGDPGQAVVDIIDNTSLSIEFEQPYYPVMEGGTVVVNVVLSNDFDTTFGVTIVPERAGDISIVPSSFTFSPGQQSLPVVVSALVDDVAELMENITLSLDLSDPGTQSFGVELGTQATTVIGVEDVSDAIVVTFAPTLYSPMEGQTVVVRLNSTQEAAQTYTIQVVQVDGFDDFEVLNGGIATFPASGKEATVEIRALTDDIKEPDEMFEIEAQLTSSSTALGVVIGGLGRADVVVKDMTPDVVVVFDPVSYSVLEGDSVVITLRTDRDFSVPFNVTLSSDNVEDVQFQSRVATFQPSNQTVSVTLDAVTDDIQELNEIVTLDFEITATIGVSKGSDSQAEVTVMDNTPQPQVTVSFDSSQYNTREGDTLTVGFTVTGQPSMPITVTVAASNGTAISSLDFTFTTASVNPLMEQVSIPIILDEMVEPEENFGLELTIPVGTAALPGNTTQATVFISDVSLITVNDTVTADPVYAVPINVVEGMLPGLPGELSLCYEIHGNADKWFNFISDKCLSLNAYYKEGIIFNRTGHVIRELALLSEDLDGRCRKVLVIMDDAGVCSVTVDGSEVNVSSSGGLMVNKNRNQIRVSVPNCDNHMVVMWASCEETFGTRMMRLVVNRGLNLRPTSHGFLGQFWNIDVALEKFNETLDALLKEREASFPHYIVHLRPPAPAKQRSFVGELFGSQWDNTPEPCLYVGSNQAGTGRADLPPLGTVVEGEYSDYIVREAFEYDYQFTRFESESCMEAK